MYQFDFRKCNICPRNCLVSRGEKKGFCRAGINIKMASQNVHYGEEPPISGTNGSGTIFFSHCNLGCKYCQNYPISHMGYGKEISIEELSDIMLKLQNKGAHNINLVTPTHYSVFIAWAIILAKKNGLKIPIVYNSSGYEKEEILNFFHDFKIVNIYLVDMKYGYNDLAIKYSNVKDYVEKATLSIKKMLLSVGYLKCNKEKIAKKGIIIRHLVLPQNFLNTKKVLDILSEIVDVKKIHISLMSQYHPAYKAYDYKELSRKITKEEYQKALDYLEYKGFKRGWIQEIN